MSVQNSDLKYWVAFTRVPQIGHVRMRLLEGYFESLGAAWSASASDFRAAGFERKVAETITTRRANVDPDGEMEALERHGVRALTWHSQEYPPLLKEIYNPPPVLFVKGTVAPEDAHSVTVVGSRRATAYGREAASVLVRDLARNGVTIVSGLAKGIDEVAHQAALDAGGRTIAVNASGLDVVYPSEHRGLAERIAQSGASVSEYPLGTRPVAQNFPRRNRILSGLTLGTLVVEAARHSGTLWTVRHALEQDREVFAVPGSIFSPASVGANRLVQEGAKLVTSVEEVLQELNFTVLGQQVLRLPEAGTPQAPPPEFQSPEGENEAETRLLKLLSYEPVHADDAARRSGLPIASVNTALTLLELRGIVKEVGSRSFALVREPASTYRAERI